MAITKALENGLIQLNQREVVHRTILEIVEHKALINHFAQDNKVLNEQTIIQKEGIIIKPDRMVITPEKKVYLLDYKTGLPKSNYSIQLKNYQKAIEDMGFIVVEKVIVYIGTNLNVVIV